MNYIEKAMAILNKIKDPISNDHKWKNKEKEIVEILFLYYESGLTQKSFSKLIKINNASFWLFLRGRNQNGKFWPKLVAEIILTMPYSFVDKMEFEPNYEYGHKIKTRKRSAKSSWD